MCANVAACAAGAAELSSGASSAEVSWVLFARLISWHRGAVVNALRTVPGALAGSGFDSGRWQFMPHASSAAWRLWLRLSTDLALIDSDYPYVVCYNSHVTRYLRCIKRTEAAQLPLVENA